MNAHEVYQIFRQEDKLPESFTIAGIMEWGDTRTLELISMLYAQKNVKINMNAVFSSVKDDEHIISSIERMFTPRVLSQSCISESLMNRIPQVRIHASDVPFEKTIPDSPPSAPVTPRQGPRQEPDVSNMPTLNLSAPKQSTCTQISALDFTDDAMTIFAKPRIRILSDYLKATVKNEWVYACASNVTGDDRSKYKLADIGSNRHRHIVNASVPLFLRELSIEIPDDKTVTWQFARDGKCIHIGQLQKALDMLCPGRGVYLAAFACSIGIPTRGFMDTVTILKKWHSGRYKKLESIVPIIKILLRGTFDIRVMHPDLESNQLIDAYRESVHIFRLPDTEHIRDVDRFMSNVFYTYPSKDEISLLYERLHNNIQRWTA